MQLKSPILFHDLRCLVVLDRHCHLLGGFASRKSRSQILKMLLQVSNGRERGPRLLDKTRNNALFFPIPLPSSHHDSRHRHVLLRQRAIDASQKSNSFYIELNNRCFSTCVFNNFDREDFIFLRMFIRSHSVSSISWKMPSRSCPCPIALRRIIIPIVTLIFG